MVTYNANYESTSHLLRGLGGLRGLLSAVITGVLKCPEPPSSV